MIKKKVHILFASVCTIKQDAVKNKNAPVDFADRIIVVENA
jgi:hypothetical protein